MRSIRMISVIIASMIISSIAYAQTDSSSHPNYVRETVLETKANEPPLNLRLGLEEQDYANMPEAKKYGFSMASGHVDSPEINCGPSFNVNNEGDLILCKPGSLKIFHLNSSQWMFFAVPHDSTEFILRAISGPNDEIFISKDKIDADKKVVTSKFIRFDREKSNYKIDQGFSPITLSYGERSRGDISISPDGSLYCASFDPANPGEDMQAIYKPNGQFQIFSKSICRTSNGIEFFPDYHWNNDDWLSNIFDLREKRPLPFGEIPSVYHASVRCTFDNEIIWLYLDISKVDSFEGNEHFTYNAPSALITNPIDGTKVTIDPILECSRKDFRYTNIGPMAANFKGDIFCFVVYFNTPGKITGDEKIVLYRWRKIQEK